MEMDEKKNSEMLLMIYTKLFNTVSDACDMIKAGYWHEARVRLMLAQQECEEIYMSYPEDPEPLDQEVKAELDVVNLLEQELQDDLEAGLGFSL